ncbi:MAG TPA: S8 family serine peptidase [Steroidobacteraceae bacterium]|nr:S8 family serine peptidase [Steroidobacteraceae bacterium]
MINAAADPGRFGTAFDWLGVERAWQRTRGSATVLIAIVDQGVQLDHPLLGANLQHDPAHPPHAAGEHDIAGTHAAGVAAGRASDAADFSGVAPEARILPVRYRTDPGAQAFDLAHAIEYAVEMGAHIVNVGHDAEMGTSAVRRAVQYAATRNVLVVCAARPRAAVRSDDEGPPPNLVTVLSVDEEFQPLADCAADIAAPGFARVPHWRGTGHVTRTHAAIGAPYVSGCAALIKSLNPGWGYHELREHLLLSAVAHPRIEAACPGVRALNVADAVQGPIEIASEARSMQWSSLNDALLSWRLRYRSAFCINAVALYRPHGDEHWRELSFARAASLHMVVPAAALRRSSGTLRIASREANFHSEEIALTIR